MDVLKNGHVTYQEIVARCGYFVRFFLPAIICFFCIGLFLLLSFALIERFSITEIMRKDRELTVYEVTGD